MSLLVHRTVALGGKYLVRFHSEAIKLCYAICISFAEFKSHRTYVGYDPPQILAQLYS